MSVPRRLLAGCLLLAAAVQASEPAPGSASLFDAASVWTSDRGEPVRLAQFRGRSVVITMAYSSCGKVCVATLRKLEALQARADAQGREIEFVVVGYNPLLDTPAAWAAYRQSHHLARANWHFLTGSDEDTHALARQLAIDYWLYDDHVMHDFKIVLLGEDGRPRKALAWDDRGTELF